MKLLVVGACLVTLTVLGASPAAAQQQAGVKLAYVNSQAILKQTPGYAQAESTFAKELETYRG
ncbi:MAG TPA: hypothetical protein VFH40_13385, partial [Gemmatimonadales bacterium]|nr:hypothetical protein [Gemmatimonadales bacterium]